MAGPNFAAILNRKGGESERPPPIPGGHWQGIVQKPVFGTDQRGNRNDFCDFPVKLVAPMDDVDRDKIEEVTLEKILARKPQSNKKYLTEESLWALDEFLEGVCGIEPSGRSYKEIIPEATGVEVVVEIIEDVSSRPGQEPRPISYLNRDSVMSLDAWERSQDDDGLDDED